MIDSQKETAAIAADIKNWYRDFHANPELSFEEHETSNKIAALLESFGGITVTRPDKTGVIGNIKGNTGGKTVLFRADIDALSLQENSGCAFASKKQGVMHACGHDGHTAMLLGAAKILAKNAHNFKGEIRLVFQHAEEMFPGGAKTFVAAGVTKDADIVLGCHLNPYLPAGSAAFISGAMLACPYSFTIKICGKGGHAASPHQTIDPINIGASIVSGFNGIISRMRNPLHRVVITVTQFHAGSADNIIPHETTLKGTVRILDPECEKDIFAKMEAVIASCCSVQGATFEFSKDAGYAALVTDQKVTAEAETVAKKLLGTEKVLAATPGLAGDDFSAYLNEIPGTFYLVGARPKDSEVYPHHHPKFAIDEDGLLYGTKLALTELLNFTGNDI